MIENLFIHLLESLFGVSQGVIGDTISSSLYKFAKHRVHL